MHAHISTVITQIYAQICKKKAKTKYNDAECVALGIYLIKSTPRWQPPWLPAPPIGQMRINSAVYAFAQWQIQPQAKLQLHHVYAAYCDEKKRLGIMPNDNSVGVHKCAYYPGGNTAVIVNWIGIKCSQLGIWVGCGQLLMGLSLQRGLVLTRDTRGVINVALMARNMMLPYTF